ncbi:MAG: DNA polymerase/3'-5' exonuclease PolX [Bacteroidetes bacterium]|nr:DNA polymerase/3'-5' exonuclease PolX [Bacteroidota bacterium]
MTNKEISRALRLAAGLSELHDANPFKVRSLNNAAFQIDRLGVQLSTLQPGELTALPGIGKGIASDIAQLLNHGSFNELDELLRITPAGVVSMLEIKGLGPKKLSQLWHSLGIESPGELLYACSENRLVSLPGFGTRTQEKIKEAIEYKMANQGILLYADAEFIVSEFIGEFEKIANYTPVVVSELRRKMEIIPSMELLADDSSDNLIEILKKIETVDGIDFKEEEDCIEFRFREQYEITIHLAQNEGFEERLMLLTGPAEHLEELGLASAGNGINTEEELYAEMGYPFILPELRDLPLEQAAAIDADSLVKLSDIKGTIHNHSTWSDGANTLEEMAVAARDLGLEYLIICDHSRTAVYAGGLSIGQLQEQWEEIDRLNSKLAPFHIFKGIESDILSDGSLDYPDDVLAKFDLVVASVHSVLNMDEERATARLIKAIEHPATKMLGHLSGRLLLSRKAYPLDYRKIIDACKANHVIMELNANPRRLDIDWRYIPMCMENGVKISVNPDAHRIEGYHDMRYGIEVARKGGLTTEFLFNSASRDEIQKLLKNW